MIDYEKKYNEALERAKHALDCDKAGLVTTDRVLIESMFPELGESEDELTWLTKFIEEEAYSLSMDIWDNEDRIKLKNLQRSLAWLEKQKAMDKDIIFRPLAGTDIIVAAKQALEKIEIGKEVVLAFNGAYIPVNGKTVAEICNEYFSWVEKQGEQKAIGMKSSEESLGVSSKEYNEIVNECLYGESKPTDKVEPKFKVGDWVVTSYGKVNQVIAVDKDGDGFTLDDGTYFSGSWKDDYHLWTIQDAKDGDVLVDDLGNICIYKESPFSLNSMYYSYCYGNHKYFVDGGGSHVIVDTCPASKEQRNILFKKMKEEGYEWDAEKKELKKIDTVQPKFNVGDWILYSGDHYEGVRHITKIDENGYYIERNGLPHGIIPFEHEICMTLWTIQDAKDGDVLAGSKNDVILMFRGIGNTEWDDVIDYHCYYDCYRKDFIVQEDVKYWGNIENNQLKPATKEQRDLLFSKMKEAGYEWNAEKKELKKIVAPQPKFKVGDWIANDYCTGKVIALTDDAYLLDSGQGIPFSCEHNTHLWTIQDAKDGDMLAAKECYVIFKEIDGLNIKCHCTYHYMGFNPSFHINTLQNKTAFHPATKEERDLLFSKMEEEGYQWDAEKKELKKIGESENIKNQIMSEITDLVKDYIRQKSTCDNEDGDIIIFSK